MLDRCIVDRSRESQGLFKIAVCDLHLLVRNAVGTRTVLAAAGYIKRVALDRDLYLLGRDARKLNLYNPTIRRLIDVSGRIPQMARNHGLFGRSGELKIAIGGFGHLSVVSSYSK